jgi:hypothetical protein
MGKLMREKVAQLEEIGEDTIFDRMVEGHTVKSIVHDLKIGWRTFYKWVDSVEGRRERYQEALEQSGHFYAARAVEAAQSADKDSVNVARLQVDTDKWFASKLNQTYDVRQRETTVTLKVEDLHAQAAALISDEVEKEIIELDEDGSLVDQSDDDGQSGGL